MTYIIYKIYKQNSNYVFVDYTKCLKRRKNEHKKQSILYLSNKKCKNYELYENINGNWNEWKMIELEELSENIELFEIKNKTQEWLKKLQNELINNTINKEKELLKQKEQELKQKEQELENKIIEKEITDNELDDDELDDDEWYPYIIYKISSNKCNEIYIGSTNNYRQRKKKHIYNANGGDKAKSHYKIYKTINEYGGWKYWKMEIIETCDETIKTKTDARIKEQEWINKLNATLNSQKAYISDQERIEYNKQKCKKWLEENKEYSKEQRKDYRDNNAEKIKEQKHNDYEKHKEKRQEQQKIYRENNPEKIKKQKQNDYEKNKTAYLQRAAINREKKIQENPNYRKKQVKCNCGVIFRKEDKARHFRSNTHTEWIKKNPDKEIILTELETNYNKDAVIQYDLEMNEINRFNSPKDAAEKLDIKKENITKCCRGNQKSTSGFTFRYIEPH